MAIAGLKKKSISMCGFMLALAGVALLGVPQTARAWDHFACQLSITELKDRSPSPEKGEYFYAKRLPQPKIGEVFDDIYLFMGQRDDLVARLKLRADQNNIVGSIFYSQHGGLGLASMDRVGPDQALANSKDLSEVYSREHFDPKRSLTQQNNETFGPIIHFHQNVGHQFLRARCLVCSSKNPNCSRIIDEKTNRELKGSDGSPMYRAFEITESDEKNPKPFGGR